MKFKSILLVGFIFVMLLVGIMFSQTQVGDDIVQVVDCGDFIGCFDNADCPIGYLCAGNDLFGGSCASVVILEEICEDFK